MGSLLLSGSGDPMKVCEALLRHYCVQPPCHCRIWFYLEVLRTQSWPALGRQRISGLQRELQTSQSYTMRPWLKTNKRKMKGVKEGDRAELLPPIHLESVKEASVAGPEPL